MRRATSDLQAASTVPLATLMQLGQHLPHRTGPVEQSPLPALEHHGSQRAVEEHCGQPQLLHQVPEVHQGTTCVALGACAASAWRCIPLRHPTGDARRAAGELTYPFQLEDKRYNPPEELVAAWVKQLRTHRTDLMNLAAIEVLSMAAMEKKYGKPPARLGLGSPFAQGGG